MNDLKKFEHGEEGTHSMCGKHGDNLNCCECNKRIDCGDLENDFAPKHVSNMEQTDSNVTCKLDEQWICVCGKKGGKGGYCDKCSWKPKFEDWYNEEYKEFWQLTDYIEKLILNEKQRSENDQIRKINEKLPQFEKETVRSTASQIIEEIEKLKGDKALTEHPYFEGFTPIGAWKSALDSAKQLIISKYLIK